MAYLNVLQGEGPCTVGPPTHSNKVAVLMPRCLLQVISTFEHNITKLLEKNRLGFAQVSKEHPFAKGKRV